MVRAVRAGGNTEACRGQTDGEIAAITKNAAFVQKAEEQGAQASYMNPEQLAEYTRAELGRWQAVVKSAGINAE